MRGYTPPPDPQLTRVLGWFPGPLHGCEYRRDGIDTLVCEMRLGHNPRLAAIKHLNRLEQVLARAELAQRGAPEGIMLDTEGNLVSGTMSNLFLIRGDRLITADVDRCGVAGIVREILLEQAERWGLEPHVRKINGDDVQSADELFFTNSIIGIWPARRLGEHGFPGMDRARRILADLISGSQVRSN
jgi:4-amino-4-deoxychorismate lyase